MIAIVEDFILEKDKNTISEFIGFAKLTDLVYEKKNREYVLPSKILLENENKDLYSISSKYVEEADKKIKQCLGVEVLPEKHFQITVFSKGESLNPHYDAMPAEFYKNKTPNGHPSRDISTVIYLNNNYSGGFLKFPFLNISIKPSFGSLIIFPSSEKYTHLVEEVTDGSRYIIPQFWCAK
jgi:Rps23 Pro-64 3,4-dihydroxylase Tpa1-like proline 4-hydroxylase